MSTSNESKKLGGYFKTYEYSSNACDNCEKKVRKTFGIGGPAENRGDVLSYCLECLEKDAPAAYVKHVKKGHIVSESDNNNNSNNNKKRKSDDEEEEVSVKKNKVVEEEEYDPERFTLLIVLCQEVAITSAFKIPNKDISKEERQLLEEAHGYGINIPKDENTLNDFFYKETLASKAIYARIHGDYPEHQDVFEKWADYELEDYHLKPIKSRDIDVTYSICCFA